MTGPTASLPGGGDGAAPTLPPLPPPERLQALLFDAARLGRDDMIAPLIQAGADIEAQDEKGYTPLILASYHGHEATAAALLALGARPDGQPGATGNSALMGVAFKGHVAIARRLLTAGADANYRNVAGQTALMMAALVGRAEIVDLLLSAGADASAVDAAGNSAVTLAGQQGNVSLAELLSTQCAKPAAVP